MTASAAPAVAGIARRRRPRPRIDRIGLLVEIWLRTRTSLVYAFLYLPIVIVVLFSFNANRLATIWTGFSLEWYGRALDDDVVTSALRNSFSVALPNAILATTFGTMAALGLQRVPRGVRIGFDALTYIAIIVPEIVIALSTLVLFASTSPLWPARLLVRTGCVRLSVGTVRRAETATERHTIYPVHEARARILAPARGHSLRRSGLRDLWRWLGDLIAIGVASRSRLRAQSGRSQQCHDKEPGDQYNGSGLRMSHQRRPSRYQCTIVQMFWASSVWFWL